MLTFTIIMIFAYTLNIILAVFTNELFKKTDKEFSKVVTDEKVTMLLLGCGAVGFTVIYLITYIIYLFNALNVDTLQYPTYIMLGLVVLNFIIAAIKNIYRKITKTEPKNKTTLYGYVLRVLTYLYFVYMLYILIVGI